MGLRVEVQYADIPAFKCDRMCQICSGGCFTHPTFLIDYGNGSHVIYAPPKRLCEFLAGNILQDAGINQAIYFQQDKHFLIHRCQPEDIF